MNVVNVVNITRESGINAKVATANAYGQKGDVAVAAKRLSTGMVSRSGLKPGAR